MRQISEELFNKEFCNSYRERYDVPPKTTAASSPDDRLRAICRYSQGKGSILEIRTWIGRSALGFSQNYSEVVTIDYPDSSDINYDYLGMKPGQLVADVPNVTCILKDSQTFDFSQYIDKFDAVYVDGNHTMDCCLQDLITAHTVCKNGGLVFVDDYYAKRLGVRDAFDLFNPPNQYTIPSLNLVFFLR